MLGTTLLPGFATAAGPSPYAFFFADLSATVPGVDVVYVTDDRTTADGGIQKWRLVGGTWTLNGTIGGNTTAARRGLTGSVSGSSVALVASGNGLFTLTDATGYNAAPTVALAPVATALAARATADLALYPNLAQDVLTIGLATGSAAGHTAELRDLLGRPVRTATLPASGQLSLAGLSAGTYLLSLDGGLSQRTSKVNPRPGHSAATDPSGHFDRKDSAAAGAFLWASARGEATMITAAP